MVLSVGENLLSTLAIVGLVAVFIAALAHSYHIYAERTNAYDDFNLALDIAERIKNQVLVTQGGQPGLLELSSERLEDYSQLLAIQGVSMRVEVRSLNGELLFSHGPEPDLLQCSSSPIGVSLPIAAVETQWSAKPCEISVQVWRG